MTPPALARSAALAALTTLAALGCAATVERKVAVARPAVAAAPTAPEPATPEGLLPGIPLEGLTAPQREVLVAWSQETFCYCGCPHTVTQCLRTHGGCHHAKKMARLAAKLAAADVKPAELQKVVTDYYASFDPPSRARLDLTRAGAPLGDPTARISLVEFSDFTCPYCQLFRPTLEQFVTDRRSRVKLFYKPFPIESHTGAIEAAQAAEWARQKGIFWPMHDRLFANPHAPPSELASWARELGQDGADLAAALEDGRLLPVVRASQAEGRAAGLRATPTVYFEGRRLTVPDLTEWMLEFTLQDEEEWQTSGGWARDD
jgi:protein-disulfide isomerase